MNHLISQPWLRIAACALICSAGTMMHAEDKKNMPSMLEEIKASRAPFPSGIWGYAYAVNVGTQIVTPGGFVTFDTSSFPFTPGIVTPPTVNGDSFTIVIQGTYLIRFQVRGTPSQLTPPHPLIFEITSNGAPLGMSQYAADSQTTDLAADQTEVVNGYVIANLPANAVIKLHNITDSQNSNVTLTAATNGTAINASLLILGINPNIV